MILSIKREDNARRLSRNFRAGEFSCSCSRCKQILVDEKLVSYLQRIRDHFGAEVTVTSGYRCPTHNRLSGGTDGSYHVKGQAADIRIKGIAPRLIAQFAEEIDIRGIGLYDDFVHIDTRDWKSFWCGHEQKGCTTFTVAEASTFEVQLRVLCRGCQGKDVIGLQAQLAGYDYGLAVDGIFGSGTEKAVKAYQKAAGLAADGIVGKQTRIHMLGL